MDSANANASIANDPTASECVGRTNRKAWLAHFQLSAGAIWRCDSHALLPIIFCGLRVCLIGGRVIFLAIHAAKLHKPTGRASDCRLQIMCLRLMREWHWSIC